jgi:hypothetical protein
MSTALSSEIVRIAYGAPAADALFVPVRPLGSMSAVEEWPLPDGTIFGAVTVDDSRSLEEATREIYARLISEVREAGYPYFLRIWNYVGGINAHDGGRERYQLFCAGRHDAFVGAGRSTSW